MKLGVIKTPGKQLLIHSLQWIKQKDLSEIYDLNPSTANERQCSCNVIDN